jgi:ornithine carbamoyltransferase
MAKPDMIYMHCLPGYRSEDEVDGSSSPTVSSGTRARTACTEKAVLALTMA